VGLFFGTEKSNELAKDNFENLVDKGIERKKL
jgi:hypothetical protein